MNTQSTEKAPAMQFYVRDHLVDTQCLSLSARGVWMTVLCHLWLQPERGTMTKPLAAWAQLLGTDVAELRALFAEIAQGGVGEVEWRGGNGEVTPEVTPEVADADGLAWLECAVGNTRVALTCRRMRRDRQAQAVRRGQTRERVAAHRLRQRGQSTPSGLAEPAQPPAPTAEPAGNAPVTPPSSIASATASASADKDTPQPPAAGEVKRKRHRAKATVTTPVVLPPCLDVPAFRASWERWQRHHQLRRRPLPPTTVEAQLAHLAEMGSPERAVASIEQSIVANWQGLFPPREAPAHPRAAAQPANPPPAAASSWQALATAHHA